MKPFTACKQLFGDDGQQILLASSNANVALDPHTKLCQQKGTIDVADCNQLHLILY